MKGAIGKHMMDDGKMMAGKSHEEAMESGEHEMKEDGSAEASEQPKGGGEQSTPEEQDAYERAVLAGMDIIFDKSTNPGILKMLQSQADNPAQAIAQTTAMIIQMLEEKSQGKLPEVIILDLADEIGGNLMDLGAKNGFFTADETLKGKAAQQINILLGQMYGFDQEDAEGLLAGVPEEELAKIQAEQSAIAGGA